MSTYATVLKTGSWINIIDATTEQGKRTQASVEAENYDVRQLPNSDFLTLEDKATDSIYVVAKMGKGTEQKVICSCKYFKESGKICEHIIALKDVKISELDATSEALINFLRATNWHDDEHGRFVPPDNEEPIIDASPKEQTKPEAKPRPKTKPKKEEIPPPPKDVPPPPKREKKTPPKENTAMARREKSKMKTDVTKIDNFPSDAELQRAAVERSITGRGSIYSVRGKKVPDSAAVQDYAASKGVSIEIIVAEQSAEAAKAIVRAHRGSTYCDDVVILRKDIIESKFLIDLAEKHPDWMTGWVNGLPEFDPMRKVPVGDKSKILALYIAGSVEDKWLFAIREATSKAARRASLKVLGMDDRSAQEVGSEEAEMKAVANTSRR